jgi:mannan endo-1,4-beta-mannosidase
MTSPPPALPGRGHRAPRPPGGVTRIVPTDELPHGIDALASADGKTIMVRASLDRASRKRAMHEVMATIRRFPRLALYPAVTTEAIRQALRRLAGLTAAVSQNAAQLASAAGDHLSGIAVAVTAAAGAAVAVTAVMATSSPGAGQSPGGPGAAPVPAASARAGAHPVAHASLPADPLHYLGVYADGVPGSVNGINQFAVTTGQQPNVALYYSSWNEKFKLGFAGQAYDDGATPAVQIEPFGVSLADIAAGKYDAYLTAYAGQVAAFGHAVIIGFAHEPDGAWYPWGAGGDSPRTWISAWRHVVQVFRRAGADNVIWLWTVNSQGPYAAAVRQWWPGAAYVTWIGLDGYYVRPGDSFTSVFGPALAATQDLGKPVLIAETAVGPGTGDQPAGIANLFAGLRAHRLLGLIWFDKAQDHGQYHEDWQLAGNTPATRAFRTHSVYLSP